MGWGKRYLLSLDGTAEECDANDQAQARVLNLDTNTLSGVRNIHSLIAKSLRRWQPETMDSACLKAILEERRTGGGKGFRIWMPNLASGNTNGRIRRLRG